MLKILIKPSLFYLENLIKKITQINVKIEFTVRIRYNSIFVIFFFETQSREKVMKLMRIPQFSIFSFLEHLNLK